MRYVHTDLYRIEDIQDAHKIKTFKAYELRENNYHFVGHFTAWEGVKDEDLWNVVQQELLERNENGDDEDDEDDEDD